MREVRVRADARNNRAAVVAAARVAFVAEGPEASLTRIAEDAGVGIGTLYRHFPTRELLIVAVLQALLEGGRAVIEESMSTPWTDPEQRWRDFVLSYGAQGFSSVVSALGTPERLTTLPAELWAGRAILVERLGAVLDRARDHGLLAEDVTLERFLLVLAVVTRPLPEASQTFVPNEQEWLLDVALRGLRPT